MQKKKRRKTKRRKKWTIGLYRETSARPGKAVYRGRLTPGAPMPDGETAESNPGK